MSNPLRTDTRPAGTSTSAGTGTGREDDLLPVTLGDIAELTEGQGGGQSEDKRRAYNS
ncbi:albusnodin family lasso peptide [Streptomyces paludis]|uniref:Albusnodin family lasso peptide n=1 Tax=Streptomyces paludis TaxID=2282738 RepID=A0A345HT64_9ACTN|nr:albusnodin family lasso peptide [Streptomyces paludis]AXG79888.1 albusnodin family lasso peptide [Streptomyces paludis]